MELPVSDANLLDAGQYSDEGIDRYERIYGRDFVSPGGAETAREFIRRLQLRENMQVLDAGCGLGGAAFVMAGDYGASVTGIDLSANMIRRARDRCRALGLDERVRFHHGDVTAFGSETGFDAVHSRDVFLHIADKPALFATLFRALKPGGRLLITDYCRGAEPASAGFERYIAKRGYHLLDMAAYESCLHGAGFTDMVAEDLTDRFIDIHFRELEAIAAHDGSSTGLSDLVTGWREKIERARRGEQGWGLFMASKPVGKRIRTRSSAAHR